jgi:hypothetical protein
MLQSEPRSGNKLVPEPDTDAQNIDRVRNIACDNGVHSVHFSPRFL